MNYNQTRLTQLVNNNINQRRRAVGKGTRETQYRNLLKTQSADINGALTYIMRHRVGHTYGEVWNLNTSKIALKTNKIPLQTLATVLSRKMGVVPVITVVADFITFVMMHHNVPVDVVEERSEAAALPDTGRPSIVEAPVTEETKPALDLADNSGDDDWETFADSCA